MCKTRTFSLFSEFFPAPFKAAIYLAYPGYSTLAKLEKDGLQISARQEAAPTAATRGTVAVLELVGQDRPGILHQISRILAHHHVNVEELSSDRVNAPMDGSMLFTARASVLLPANVSISQLRTELEKIASDLMVDVQLNPAGR